MVIMAPRFWIQSRGAILSLPDSLSPFLSQGHQTGAVQFLQPLRPTVRRETFGVLVSNIQITFLPHILIHRYIIYGPIFTL